MPPVECRDCHKVRTVLARGLCSACYKTHQQRGTLAQFPRLGRRHHSGHPGKKVMLEEYDHMRSLLGHAGAIARLADAYSLDEKVVLETLHRHERQAA